MGVSHAFWKTGHTADTFHRLWKHFSLRQRLNNLESWIVNPSHYCRCWTWDCFCVWLGLYLSDFVVNLLRTGEDKVAKQPHSQVMCAWISWIKLSRSTAVITLHHGANKSHKKLRHSSNTIHKKLISLILFTCWWGSLLRSYWGSVSWLSDA